MQAEYANSMKLDERKECETLCALKIPGTNRSGWAGGDSYSVTPGLRLFLDNGDEKINEIKILVNSPLPPPSPPC